jgi:hypothetical protein
MLAKATPHAFAELLDAIDISLRHPPRPVRNARTALLTVGPVHPGRGFPHEILTGHRFQSNTSAKLRGNGPSYCNRGRIPLAGARWNSNLLLAEAGESVNILEQWEQWADGFWAGKRN